MSDAQLFMIRAQFDLPSLYRFAAGSGLPVRVLDEGYTTHAILRGLFGDAAPKPFAIHSGRVRMTVLGYASLDHQQLAERAQALAEPLALAALDRESFCSKMMPDSWRAGASWNFEARVCPTVRISGRSRDEEPREVDVFLHRCWQQGKAVLVERAAVYREWLASELSRGDAAKLVSSKLERFRRTRVHRRDRSEKQTSFSRGERPDATFRGRLEVRDPMAFAALLRRGLGRHRAFGFGMLLLRH